MKKVHLRLHGCELRPVRPDVRLTSAGSLDPVTSSIPHHSPDWILPSAGCFLSDDDKRQESRPDLRRRLKAERKSWPWPLDRGMVD